MQGHELLADHGDDAPVAVIQLEVQLGDVAAQPGLRAGVLVRGQVRLAIPIAP